MEAGLGSVSPEFLADTGRLFGSFELGSKVLDGPNMGHGLPRLVHILPTATTRIAESLGVVLDVAGELLNALSLSLLSELELLLLGLELGESEGVGKGDLAIIYERAEVGVELGEREPIPKPLRLAVKLVGQLFESQRGVGVEHPAKLLGVLDRLGVDPRTVRDDLGHRHIRVFHRNDAGGNVGEAEIGAAGIPLETIDQAESLFALVLGIVDDPNEDRQVRAAGRSDGVPKLHVINAVPIHVAKAVLPEPDLGERNLPNVEPSVLESGRFRIGLSGCSGHSESF